MGTEISFSSLVFSIIRRNRRRIEKGMAGRMKEEHGNRQIELLAPAGSYETFRAVLQAGADAVYLGGSQFGARAYANNFSEEELLMAIDYAHMHGRQVYLTVNTLFKEDELEGKLYQYLLPYYKQGLDAVIVQDMGAFSLIRSEFPRLDIHTSTQMTVTGRYGAEYMKQLGASRVVTAREMSFAEIKDIHEHVDIEIESFVHGALCYCFSGQCLMSSMLGGRSGNRGRCAQPCRLPYEVYDNEMKKLPGKGEFVLSPKDLNTIRQLPQLIESGIYSFKIEGRMKQAEYAAGVVSVYREAIDRYFAEQKRYEVSEKEYQKLMDLGNRSGFTDGYYRQWNGADMITFGKPNHAKANEKLQEEIREKYIDTEIKEKINGILRLKKDFPAMIELSYGNYGVKTEGSIVQAALKQPLSLEKVETNMRKTGGTPFEFEQLSIEMDEDVFLPVQAVNQLRRDALEKLQALVTSQWRREEAEASNEKALNLEKTDKCSNTQAQSGENLAVSVERRSQIAEVLRWKEVNDVYIDSSSYLRRELFPAFKEDALKVHHAGKKVYYIFPAVFRKKTAEFYQEHLAEFLQSGLDGVVVKSFDAAVFAKKYLGEKVSIILDHSLYSWNDRAKVQFLDFTPLRDTVPLELNRKEIFGRNNRGSEIVLYGHLPLMTTAQCIHANLRGANANPVHRNSGCDGQPTVTYLKDRYGKYFPVKNNCAECYNTIYNTTPLVLFGFHEDFQKMGIAGYRISFTIEEEETIHEIMKRYCEVFVTGEEKISDVFSNGTYTNGHYKRGVE